MISEITLFSLLEIQQREFTFQFSSKIQFKTPEFEVRKYQQKILPCNKKTPKTFHALIKYIIFHKSVRQTVLNSFNHDFLDESSVYAEESHQSEGNLGHTLQLAFHDLSHPSHLVLLKKEHPEVISVISLRHS